MKKVIPPEREQDILARAGQGESADTIARWLTTKLGRHIDGRRVREFLEKQRKERAPITRALIAEKVATKVGADLDSLQTMIGELDGLKFRMNEAGDLRGIVMALREQHALVKTRLELNGSGVMTSVSVVDPYAEPPEQE